MHAHVEHRPSDPGETNGHCNGYCDVGAAFECRHAATLEAIEICVLVCAILYMNRASFEVVIDVEVTQHLNSSCCCLLPQINLLIR